jgi:hypothetical protein
MRKESGKVGLIKKKWREKQRKVVWGCKSVRREKSERREEERKREGEREERERGREKRKG